MAFIMSMHWPEFSLDQYEQARREVEFESNVPAGALFHIAWMADDGFRVIDLWESPEDFQRFNDSRLAPAVQRIGTQGQPNVTFSEAHNVFNARVAQKSAGGRTPARRASARRRAAKAPKKSTRARKPARKTAGKRRPRR